MTYAIMTVVEMKGKFKFIIILMIFRILKTFLKFIFLIINLRIGKFDLCQKVVKLLQNMLTKCILLRMFQIPCTLSLGNTFNSPAVKNSSIWLGMLENDHLG